MKRHSGRSGSRKTQYILSGEISTFCILLRHYLYLAFCHTFVRKPAETHPGLRVTVDSGYHTIGIFLRLQRRFLIHQMLDKGRHGIIYRCIKRVVLRAILFSRRFHRTNPVCRSSCTVVRYEDNSLFGFRFRHAGKRSRIAEMRTFGRFIVGREPGLLKEMTLKSLVGTAHSRFALIRYIIGRIYKPVLVPVAPHRAGKHRTLGMDAAVPVAVVIGNRAAGERAVEIRHTACVRPFMTRSRAVMYRTFLQLGS